MNKFYIVENIEFDTKFKTDEEIKEFKWKSDNGLGVWSSEGKTEDERISKLFDKVQDYMGVYLTSLEYCNNRPHPLTSVQVDSLRTGTRGLHIRPRITYNKSIQKGVTSCFKQQSTSQTHQEQNTTDGQIGQLGIVRYGSEEMRVFIT